MRLKMIIPAALLKKKTMGNKGNKQIIQLQNIVITA
jgi:hypothetical protein